MHYLDQLENEAIGFLREAAFQFKNPYILFSGGKDSICLVHLALKAFSPGPFPFKLLHIDTGHNFPETLEFRDAFADKHKLHIEVRLVTDTLLRKNIPDVNGRFPSRNALQTHALLEAIEDLHIDACIGGARRDEEKARAKERIFSFRNEKGEWNPLAQRPEPWNLLNGKIEPGENVRVFPISNWTELDIWHYIERDKIELPTLYFAHNRLCLILEDQALMAFNPYLKLESGDELAEKIVRFRTIGDMTCTAAVESKATQVSEVIEELKSTKISERGATRLDDRISEAGMEDRKRQGYF